LLAVEIFADIRRIAASSSQRSRDPAPGFVGFTGDGNTSGGNGVSLVNDATELWSGDGDSAVKVIDLKAGKIVDTISTGGKKRANETDFDPVVWPVRQRDFWRGVPPGRKAMRMRAWMYEDAG
jgi:hypothetical protein